MSPSIIVQPLIKVLSLEAITQVHYSSLKILSEIVIRIDSKDALKRLKNSTG